MTLEYFAHVGIIVLVVVAMECYAKTELHLKYAVMSIKLVAMKTHIL